MKTHEKNNTIFGNVPNLWLTQRMSENVGISIEYSI